VNQPSCPIVLDPTGRDIQGEAARLREYGSATLVELPGGVEVWAVTSQDRVRELFTDRRVSKDPWQHWPRWINGEVTGEWPMSVWISLRTMFTTDGEEHRRLRSLISKAFTARRVEALRPRVEQITQNLLDALAAQPAGEVVDLREEFAYPLPIEVICRLIGVPDAMRPRLRSLVEGGFDTAATEEQAGEVRVEIWMMLQEIVALKRQTPGDDLTSELIAVRGEDGSRLSEEEMVGTLIVMIAAGHETTVNLLDHAITALIRHPEQLARVQSGQNSWNDVIDETLRWQPPGPNILLRYAIEDIEFDGVTIHKGDAIIASMAAAGRDPQHWGEDADRFDISRAKKDHISFGHGMHYCLGAPMARLEAETALPALFDRFPKMTLAVAPDELQPVRSLLSNGHLSLPAILG
jgi:cytochrome P450